MGSNIQENDILKSCPFCGGQAKKSSISICGGHGIYFDEFYVVCKTCGARGPKMDNYYGNKDFSKVSELWNNRFCENGI